MAEIENSLRDVLSEYEEKLREGVLPPDPARVIANILEDIPELEHATPLPPLIEKIHKEIILPLIEKLPRLPLTRDFGKY